MAIARMQAEAQQRQNMTCVSRFVLRGREEAHAMVDHVRDKMRAVHEARLQEWQLEVEAKLRLNEADAEWHHEKALAAWISGPEAAHSQMLEMLRGDLAAKDAANSDLLARLADLDGRHRATGAKDAKCPQSEAALEKTCRSLRDKADELKTDGARALAVQPKAAEETIARLQSALGTLDAQLTATMTELSVHRTQSDGGVANLRGELSAARQGIRPSQRTGATDVKCSWPCARRPKRWRPS